MSRNDTQPHCEARLRRIAQRADEIRHEWDRKAAQEELLALESMRFRLPHLADHPGLPRFIRARVAPLALDLPAGWPTWLQRETEDFFRKSAWIDVGAATNDTPGRVSISACRSHLGPAGREASDEEVQFFRDLLYQLAEAGLSQLEPGRRGGE